MKVTGATKVVCIIGFPVEHSLSPLMQNKAFEAVGLDVVYIPFSVAEENLASAVKGLKSLGVIGFNVTIPHKSSIIPFLDRLSPDALLIGAVNTVKREGDELVGYNTDGAGFLKSVKEDLGFEPSGSRVLVLGAGGASRAAVAALCQAGAVEITIANRSVGKGINLIEDLRGVFSGTKFAAIPLDNAILNAAIHNADLVVNTTSIGMGGSVFAGLDLACIKPGASLYDMVYVPFETPLLAAARKIGINCTNGIGMLAAQGEYAFKIWTGIESPSGVMKSGLLAVMGF